MQDKALEKNNKKWIKLLQLVLNSVRVFRTFYSHANLSHKNQFFVSKELRMENKHEYLQGWQKRRKG